MDDRYRWLGQKVNWHYGFVAAGVGMVAGLVFYRATRRYLGSAGTQVEPAYPKPQRQRQFLTRSWLALGAGIAAIVLAVALGYAGVVGYAPVAMAVWVGAIILAMGLGFMGWMYFAGGLDDKEKKRLLALGILSASW